MPKIKTREHDKKITTLRLPLKNIFVENKECQLELVINITRNNFKSHMHDIVGHIELPKNYPETKFAKILKKEEENKVLFLSLRTGNDKDYMSKYFESKKDYFLWSANDPVEIIFLFAFYVRTRAYTDIATAEEVDAMRGLGKLALQKTLLFAKKEGLFCKNKKTFLVAEASGGDVKDCIFEKYKKYDKNVLGNILDTQYPEALYYYSHDSVESMAELLATIEENAKLVEYYQSNYGFKVMQRSLCTGVLIGAPLENVINCTFLEK